ncbi:hypothetical protein [Pseudoalteromonas sp. MMG012]|uniref:hypothetical protein n=1 Tax=Pseudoalteromonas sp. MMG012 TaxID=2822686 RepID=UPI001B3A2B3D|nr:hypothetical protein [Pseudoalteromonas sp. MMG012]MBQ4849236.1 hypothetical protein [Pseudoalteromonas sp. MMG012]
MINLRWVFLFFIIFILSLDAKSRFFISNGNAELRTESPTPIQKIKWQTADKSSEILERYKQYQELEDGGRVVENEDEMSLPNGEYTKALYQNKQIELKAVLSGTEVYALLNITNLSDNTSKLVKVREGENVLGFSLNVISQIKVELSAKEKKVLLMMYQPQMKEKV